MGFDSDLIKVGKEAELVLFDDKEEWVFNKKHILSKSKNSPFQGHQLSGKIKMTIAKGYLATI